MIPDLAFVGFAALFLAEGGALVAWLVLFLRGVFLLLVVLLLAFLKLSNLLNVRGHCYFLNRGL